MCRIVITKLQCKKANCTTIYGSFRDDERTEYCELEGVSHRVSQRSRTEKGDEYCPDCEAAIATRRVMREVNRERGRNDYVSARERDYYADERRRQREEDDRRRQEYERREREAEEYRQTGRWPGLDMQSGFFGSRGHNSRRRR